MKLNEIKNKKIRILDATAGFRGIWFDKNEEHTIYIDIRPETNPDYVMDCTKTNFPDKFFNLIVFDPPHIGTTPNNKGIMGKRYHGGLRTSEIRELIKKAFKEFYRILKDDGFVLFKWNNHDQKLPKILSLIENFKPLFGQKVSVSTKHVSRTYWVCLIKKRLDTCQLPPAKTGSLQVFKGGKNERKNN